MKVLMIIPAYNEEKNILNVCKSIDDYNLNNNKVDYIVINDGSTDNTGNICKEKNIPCINLINNLGIGGAVQTGYQYAYYNDYDIAIQFDGDGQHDINYVEKLINPIKNSKADMVIGSRYIENLSDFKSTMLRRTGSKILSIILNITTHKKIYDITSGFRAVNRKIIKIFKDNYPTDYPEPESLVVVLKNDCKIDEVSVKMKKRENGKSSITPLKSIYYMIKVSYAIIVSALIYGRDK